ncbi:hypothetical protein GA0115246_111161 [Streptomyces sp. SolWspMP-sol7th]|nr:hypothetical protein GA0115246_111161 [Streptomyces sp. SolWspMP-sol7th]
MSGRGRVTLAATVATALSAAALLPLVESATWFALCLLLLALVAGRGRSRAGRSCRARSWWRSRRSWRCSC